MKNRKIVMTTYNTLIEETYYVKETSSTRYKHKKNNSIVGFPLLSGIGAKLYSTH